jgi:hypothetical protein
MALQTIGVGTVANDGTGDSIRLAFEKTNSNFQYLLGVAQNLSTGNLAASGNISLNATSPSYWTGSFYINGVQIATVGTTFSGGSVANPTSFASTQQGTSATAGQSVLVAGGLGVAGTAYIGNINSYNTTLTGVLTSAVISAGQGSFSQYVSTPQLSVQSGVGTINATGNITTVSAVVGTQGTFSIVDATLITNAQPFITSIGNLTTANVFGTLTTYSLVANGTVSAGYLAGNLASISGNILAGNIKATIGTFANVTVTSYPSSYHVPNKGYVNSTALAFAIAVGS